MRVRIPTVLTILLSSSALFGQTAERMPLAAQVIAKYPALSATHSITLHGTAQWTSGSLHESGTASLQASSDGLSMVQLELGSASETETKAPLGADRSCQRTNAKGAIHKFFGPDCSRPVPWFAPVLFINPSAAIASDLVTSDDGVVMERESSFLQASYSERPKNREVTRMRSVVAPDKVKVLYDPQTLFPSSMEYKIHSDADLNTELKVRVVYSNYQTISGLPVPFRIDRYVNNSLQISIVVSDASIN